jgi:hypothetical protein
MSRCGRCGHPEEAHQGATPDETDVLLATLRCRGYAVPRAITPTQTAPNSPLCHRCGRQDHTTESCTW